MRIEKISNNKACHKMMVMAFITVATSCSIKTAKPENSASNSTVKQATSTTNSSARTVSQSSNGSSAAVAASRGTLQSASAPNQKTSIFSGLFRSSNSKSVESSKAKTAAIVNSNKKAISENKSDLKNSRANLGNNVRNDAPRNKTPSTLPKPNPTVYETTKTIETIEGFQSKISAD